MSTIAVSDTVSVNGNGAWEVEFFHSRTRTPDTIVSVGRYLKGRDESRDVTLASLTLVRKGNAPTEAANVVLARAGLPLI